MARSTGEADGHPLDPLSRHIIEQLQEDGRRPYHVIGEAVGLSEAAVRQRVQRLLAAGVMQIVAVTDPLRLGFHRQAMIGVRCHGDLHAVADGLGKLPEVTYTVLTAGSYDLIVEVVCADDEDLLRVLHALREVPGVVATDTFVYLKLHKQSYAWGAGGHPAR